MSSFDARRYFNGCRKINTHALEQILATPRMHARLNRFQMDIIRLVLRQRQRKIDAITAEREGI